MSLASRIEALADRISAEINQLRSEIGTGGGGGGGINYIGDWVAGTYPAQTLTKHLGSLMLSTTSTNEEPVPPELNYSNNFAAVPSEGFWNDSTLTGSMSITSVGGQVVGTTGEVTALRLAGVGASGGGTMWIEVTLTWAEAGSVTFWDRISSESGWDKGAFLIDGVVQYAEISGVVNWTERTFGVSAGTHTLRWRYAGDSGAGNADEYVIGALSTTGTVIGSDDWDALGFTQSKVLELISEATS
jgi:hypothetical protein